MRRYLRLGLALAVIVATALLLPRMASTREGTATRELLIVARDMTYYVDGRDEPNPRLQFKAGEQIRLTFRNEDPGMEHDFAIREWRVATRRLHGKGEDVVVFRVPVRAAAGTSAYACTPHSEMMNGQVVVE